MKVQAPLLAVLTCLLTPPAFSQLAAKPQALDFGSRGHGENPSEILVLSNPGPAQVTIRAVQPSCSCIKVDPPVQGKAIPPGGSLELRVSMGSGRAMGILEKHIDILPLEPGLRPLRVPVGMRVFDGFVMEPWELRFDGVVGAGAITQSVDVKWSPHARSQRQFSLDDARVADAMAANRRTGDHFTAKVTDIPGGKRIEVTLKPTHPEGRIWANLEAKLDGKLLMVPIAGEMFRSIKIVPTYFNFSRVALDDAASFTEESALTSTDGRPFKILSMTPRFTRTTGPDVRLGLEEKGAPGAPALEHVIRARISGGAKPPVGSFSGTVLVKTDHPEKPEVTLNFFGFFAEEKRK